MDPEGEVAEAFRSVRTAISFGAPKDRRKTVVITLAHIRRRQEHDGGQPGHRHRTGRQESPAPSTADLRNPNVNAIFGLAEVRVGLSSLLNGHGTSEQAIQSSTVPGLDLLPCGPRPRNPSELLKQPDVSVELLELLAEKYDQIIIDSPPVMGLADARIIAASCDLTLLVLRASKSTRKLSLLAPRRPSRCRRDGPRRDRQRRFPPRRKCIRRHLRLPLRQTRIGNRDANRQPERSSDVQIRTDVLARRLNTDSGRKTPSTTEPVKPKRRARRQ